VLIHGAFAAAIPTILAFYFICRAELISGVRIAAPIVLAQCEGQEGIGEAQKDFRRGSHTVLSPINLDVLTGNGNMFNTRRKLIIYYRKKNNV
jgi:hypothetical protein